MDNHYHLVVETPQANLSKGMRQLNGVYTQLYNRRHRTVGHLFQGRYKAILIQKESHLLEVCRYVVLNPVRAKAVRRVEQWKWSSYGGTAGLGKTPPLADRGLGVEPVWQEKIPGRQTLPSICQGGDQQALDLAGSSSPGVVGGRGVCREAQGLC